MNSLVKIYSLLSYTHQVGLAVLTPTHEGSLQELGKKLSDAASETINRYPGGTLGKAGIKQVNNAYLLLKNIIALNGSVELLQLALFLQIAFDESLKSLTDKYKVGLILSIIDLLRDFANYYLEDIEEYNEYMDIENMYSLWETQIKGI